MRLRLKRLLLHFASKFCDPLFQLMIGLGLPPKNNADIRHAKPVTR